MKKILDILKEIKKRLFSKVVLLGIASFFMMFLVSVGADLEDLTSWSILINLFIKFVTNPYIIISFLASVFAYLNNPTTKDKF